MPEVTFNLPFLIVVLDIVAVLKSDSTRYTEHLSENNKDTKSGSDNVRNITQTKLSQFKTVIMPRDPCLDINAH